MPNPPEFANTKLKMLSSDFVSHYITSSYLIVSVSDTRDFRCDAVKVELEELSPGVRKKGVIH